MPYAQKWEKAKADFEKMTGKHKPKESKGIFNAFGAHTGLSGSLKKCDAGEKAALEAKDPATGKKAVKAWMAAHADFKKAKDGYLKVLQKAIDEEFRLRPSKDAKSDYEKALKFLLKELDALEKSVAADAKSFAIKFDEATKDLNTTEKMIANFEANMKKVLAKAASGIAKVKANPTPEEYNALFPTAARDINMQLVFAKKMDGFLVDPDKLIALLAPYANQGGGEPSKVDKEADKDKIIGYLKGFAQACKQVDQLVGSRR